MMRIEVWSVVLVALLARPALSGAQQVVEAPARKQAMALQVQSASVRIDGRLDEEIWNQARPVTDFVQAEPEEGAPPTDQMDVRFLFDNDTLFVGARMRSSGPAPIQSPMSRRDEGIDQAEHIFISLDTYLDRRTAYTFGVTAAGVRFDHYHANDNRGSRDRGFDPVWEAQVSQDKEGWSAELRIPFHQLRFASSDKQVFGLNIYRAVPTRNEEVYWSLIPRTERGWSSQFGELHGIGGIRPTRRMEVVPYVAGSSLLSGLSDPDNPFDGRNLEARTGVDVKFGVGPNVTLDATINPDFGQVEADPAEVNLSAFETFFDERRPFFLEGSRLLGAAGGGNPWDDDDGAQYYYSRRIGARPVGDASGDFVDYPNTSMILGATKLTGRLANGTSIGILGAVTTEEHARTFDLSSQTIGEARVAPWTTYGIGRIQQEFGAAGSTASFLMTSTHRQMAEGDPLADVATRNAFTASGDSLLRFKDGEYEVGGTLGMSHVAGDPAAIAQLQRSSARYFQRPDVDYVRYDPTRTSLTGLRGGFSAARVSGRHWLWQAQTEFVTPEFEVNDLGRLSRADNISGSAEIEYRETQPSRLFRGYSISLEHERAWDFGQLLQASELQGEAEVTWPNFWETEFSVGIEQAAYDSTLTRGGPAMGTPGGWSASLRINNSQAASTRLNGRFEYGRNEDGGYSFEVGGGVTLRPTPRWRLSLEPGYERELDDQQYVTALDNGPAATFGRRYVFAFVDRTTVSTEIRLNYTFKPDMNLEFYGEPFAASGRYYDFGELTAAGSRDRHIYSGTEVELQPDGGRVIVDGENRFTLRNRDFNVLSFRSNLVLSWEWRPGSTFYVVWQQDREEEEGRGSRVGVRDLFGSFGTAGNNVFAIKTTFWFGG